MDILHLITFVCISGLVCTKVCRNGWIRYNESCYLISNTSADWAEALAICRAFGSHLLEIETAEENSFIRLTLTTKHGHDTSPPHGYWMGLNNIEVNSEYKWVSSDRPIVYQNWEAGQPNGKTTQNCGILWSQTGFTWHDDFCNDVNAYFVCEKGETVDGEVIG